MKKTILLCALAANANLFSSSAAAADFEVNGTKVTVGGWAKIDATYSDPGFNGSKTNLFPQQIPRTTDKSDPAFDMTARSSRLWFKSTTPTDYGQLKVHLEGDFLGEDNATGETGTNGFEFRLRHAYGSVGNLLIGQTWSTFMDTSVMSELLDSSQNRNAIFSRQPQIRYTLPLSNGSLMFALENSQTFTSKSPTTTSYGFNDKHSYPDFIGRWNYKGEKLNGSIALLGRQLKVDNHTSTGGGESYNKVTGAYALGVKYKVSDSDAVSATFMGGNLGRYMPMAFLPGAIDNGSSLKPIDAYGASIALSHKWSPTVRSTFMLAGTTTDDLDPVSQSGINEKTRSAHVNLLWSFTKTVRLGMEYNRTEVETAGGSKGELNRLQWTARYTF